MSTSYGAIPAPSGSSSGIEFMSRAKEKRRSIIATRKPWHEFVDKTAFVRPYGYREAMIRIKKNLAYFRVNYTLIILVIMFLSLLWHPISMIVFLVIFTAWFFLYLFRDDHLVLYGWTFDDRVVLVVLGLVTIVSLVLTQVGLNVLISIIIGSVLVVLHAALRIAEDHYLDEQDLSDQGLLSVVGGPLRQTTYGYASE